MLRQTKPTLQRGLGFGGTTLSHDAHGRLDSGTRESSLGKLSDSNLVILFFARVNARNWF